jgi:nitrite reductase/ring-hydroxylating ferredoxin subunit
MPWNVEEGVKVAKKSELGPGQIKKVVVNGKEIALYNLDGSFYATTTICPHQGGPLDEGELDGETVICPWHGWMFKVTDGSAIMNPKVRIKTYPVKLVGDDIYVTVS